MLPSVNHLKLHEIITLRATNYQHVSKYESYRPNIISYKDSAKLPVKVSQNDQLPRLQRSVDINQ
jgi:hypothetical protein